MFKLLKETYLAWDRDHAKMMAAALSYYALFALAPVLVVLISIGGIVYGNQAAQSILIDQIDFHLGSDLGSVIKLVLEQANSIHTNILASLISSLVMLVAVTGLFDNLHTALNQVWHVSEKRERRFIEKKIIAFIVLLCLGGLFLITLIFNVLEITLKLFLDNQLLSFMSALTFYLQITVFCAFTYKVLPNVKIPWHCVWKAAFLASTLVTLAKLPITYYLQYRGISSVFGVGASVLIFIIWVYYSMQIYLFGAEFCKVLHNKYKVKNKR